MFVSIILAAQREARVLAAAVATAIEAEALLRDRREAGA
jgi:hypothetical protein